MDIDGQAVQLGLPAQLYAALMTPGRGGAPETADATDDDTGDSSQVTASISGNLVKWVAEDGAEVEADDAVAVLEAMKMETTVTAARAGRFTGCIIFHSVASA